MSARVGQTLWSGLLAAMFVFVLSGCGFQLRTYNFDSSVENYAITGQLRSQVVGPLRTAMRQLDIPQVAAGEAAIVVDILEQRSDRRSVSTSGAARAAEYEIDYGVRYQLLNNEGANLAPPTWIERRRIYRIDRSNIVGSSEEENLLQRELLQDVVGQIVRAMDLVTRPEAES